MEYLRSNELKIKTQFQVRNILIEADRQEGPGSSQDNTDVFILLGCQSELMDKTLLLKTAHISEMLYKELKLE